jgi:hypothetical protein
VTRSFKTKGFARFAKREGLRDEMLCRAAEAMERGLIDADLGGGVVKQRFARPGQGKSGGYRAIVAFRRHGRVVFVFGYAKSSRSGIDARELAGFRLLAKHVLAMSPDDVDRAVEAGALEEVRCDDEAGEAVRQ